MVGNTGTLMSMRLVRSKLRKRDESSSAPQVISVQTITQPTNSIDLYSRSSNGSLREYQQPDHQISSTNNGVETLTECGHVERSSREVTFLRTSGGSPSMQPNSWIFPPKAPTPHIYNCMNDTLSVNDKNGFKGFRKQFSGRFKRLVSKKPEPAPAIPPELKPQLKTIYVY